MLMVKTQCCAIQEISMLSCYTGNAVGAMEAFCKANFAAPVKYGSSSARADTLYSFYLFTARVSYKGDRSTYGHQFADYIKENRLGRVIESEWEPNDAFHPGHGNQVWLWTPDLRAVKEWWRRRQAPSV